MPPKNSNGDLMNDVDLSDEIARTIKRQPGEQVTCRRVANNHYRCNWWRLKGTSGYDNPGMAGGLVTTSRICRSQFLRVEKTGETLVIKVISSASGEDVTA